MMSVFVLKSSIGGRIKLNELLINLWTVDWLPGTLYEIQVDEDNYKLESLVSFWKHCKWE